MIILPEVVRAKWQQHIDGLGHVSRMTVERFLTWQMPKLEHEDHKDAVNTLWDEYCDARQARLRAADEAITNYSEDI